ncbi:MAG: AsmA family protein, partial [Planctomycetes bacterium]|nr:AsmA family protein [Planctomycetota bacterium]
MDANAPSRKPRGFKIALISILTLLFLFAAAIYLLPSFLPIDTIRQMSKAKAKEMTGLDLDFRSLGFSWSGSVVLGGIVVSPAAAEGMPMPEPLLTVDEVKTNVAIAPLLSGKIVINSVEVNGFSVRLRRAADGSLNLPDFSRLTAGVQTGNASENVTSARSALLSAVAAESAANPLANIELRRLELRRGILSFEDEIESLAVDLGVDFFRVEGATFNDPFVVSGRVFPYAIDATKGEIPFTGRVAMIKNGALDLNGEASLEVDVKAFSLHELAAKLGLGELLVSGMANGIVKLGYAGSKAILSAREFHLAEVVLGLDDNLAFAAPDSSFSIEGEFDAESGVVAFSNLGLVNQLIQIQGSGWVEDIPALAAGGMPVVALEYGGTADFSDLIQYLTRQNLGLPDLPELSGEGMFSGKGVLGKQENPADPPAPTLTTDFSSGRIAARDVVTDIAVEVGLAGVSFRAAASLGEAIDINSGITLANVPVTLLAPWLGREPINIAVIGGMAVAASSSGTLAAELRLVDATAKIPDTPWSSAMEIRSPDTRITYHFENDELTIHSASFEIGEGIRGGVKSGAASGILSGEPNGQINLELSASFDQLNALFQPLVSE